MAYILIFLVSFLARGSRYKSETCRLLVGMSDKLTDWMLQYYLIKYLKALSRFERLSRFEKIPKPPLQDEPLTPLSAFHYGPSCASVTAHIEKSFRKIVSVYSFRGFKFHGPIATREIHKALWY